MYITKPFASALLATALAASFTVAPAAQAAENWQGNINLTLGAKKLKSADWDEGDNQDVMIIGADFRRNDWPVSIAVDLVGAGDERGSGSNYAEDVSGGLHVGVRKIWDLGGSNFKPFVGGGIAHVVAERTTGSGATRRKVDGDGTGAWVGGGAYWRVAEHLNLGFETRYSSAEVDLDGEDVEAGGLYTGVLVGGHW
jgi:opacity protein-like surface antigen